MSDINLKETDTPSVPTAQRHKLFIGTDGHLKKINSLGTIVDFNTNQGAGSSGTTEQFTLSAQNILDKQITLSGTPTSTQAVRLVIVGGIQQLPVVDFEIQGQNLTWAGLGLDGFLEQNDILIVSY